VQLDPKSSLFFLGVTVGNANDASHIISGIISVYQQRLKILANSKSSDLRRAFLQELDRATDQVNQLKQQLSNFTTQQNLTTLQSESSSASITYQNVARQHSQLVMALDRATTSYQALVQ